MARTNDDQETHRETWERLAVQWAHARWCWDDADDDLQGRRGDSAYANGERPDAFIDSCAEHWGLDDPTASWGALSGARDAAIREQLQASIDTFMAAGGAR